MLPPRVLKFSARSGTTLGLKAERQTPDIDLVPAQTTEVGARPPGDLNAPIGTKAGNLVARRSDLFSDIHQTCRGRVGSAETLRSIARA